MMPASSIWPSTRPGLAEERRAAPEPRPRAAKDEKMLAARAQTILTRATRLDPSSVGSNRCAIWFGKAGQLGETLPDSAGHKALTLHGCRP
jgi:hypothetical protein